MLKIERRKGMKKIIGLLTAALVIATVTSGCGGNKNQTTATGDAGASQATASTVNYVATIGDEKIPEDEFRYFLAQTKDSIEQMAGATDAATQKTFWAGKIGDQNAEDVAKDMALNNLVEYDIWLDKAKAANYTVDGQTTQSANTQLDTYIATLGTGEAGTKTYEKRYGITVDKTKVINANMSIIQKFYADQQTNTKMTDEELKKFYNDNLTKYQQVNVKQVLFLTIDQTTQQPLSQEKQDAAKKNAEDILKRVKAG
ncbi:MAG: SurA N-terminal domain-containing protein, partial [Bacillota bacterium]|nr:SurA N-terminal domain-containing protein [Bacillota bacterium]